MSYPNPMRVMEALFLHHADVKAKRFHSILDIRRKATAGHVNETSNS
jgi:hypothetical protein